MTTIAVPGGTGKIGRTIVHVLLENPNYNVLVLSRKEVNDPSLQKATIEVVDYEDVEALKRIFEAHAVHTVVSALNVNSPASGLAERNLIEAAEATDTTKRFIASDFAAPIPEDQEQIPGNEPRAETFKALRSSTLEWTSIANGTIMDCFGTPHIESYMGVYAIHVDMQNRAAAIPGTGNDPICFSYSFDIARFVEAIFGLDRWEEQMFCYSDVRTFNDVVRVAEEVTGTKFDVTYDPIEKLEQGQMTELPLHKARYNMAPKAALQRRFSLFGLYYTKGLMHFPEEQTLNHQLPQIKTHSLEDVIGAWKGKQ